MERNDFWGADLIPIWHVYRRYNDFVKLHQKICQISPEIDLQLPRKKFIGNNFDPLFLGKRMKGLSKYLKNILCHPQIANCVAIKRFLCIDMTMQITQQDYKDTAGTSNRVSKDRVNNFIF